MTQRSTHGCESMINVEQPAFLARHASCSGPFGCPPPLSSPHHSPRGCTLCAPQKRMEKETGARIVIRGRGSVKEGRLRKEGPGPKVCGRAAAVGWGEVVPLSARRRVVWN